MKCTLWKVAFNKGQTDNGVTFDYTRLFVAVPVSDTALNEFGHDLIQCEYGDSSKAKEFEHLRGKLPVDIEVELVPEMKGKRLLQVIKSYKLVQPVK